MHLRSNETLPWQAYLAPFAVLFAIFAFFFARNLVSFTPSIDDEFAVFRSAHEVWTAQGRWAVHFVEAFMMPNPILPFLPHALFGMFLSAGYLVYLNALGEASIRVYHYFLFPLFAAFPVWYFIAEFSANIVGAGIGVFFCCLACYFLARVMRLHVVAGAEFKSPKVWLSFLAASVLGGTAIGFYQSLVTLLFVLYVGLIVTSALNSPPPPKRFAKSTFLAALSLILALVWYGGVLKLCLVLWQVDPRYIQPFINLDTVVNAPRTVLRRYFTNAWGVYSGSKLVYGIAVPFLAAPLALGIAGIGYYCYRLRDPWLAAGVAAATVAILAAPFSLVLLGGVPLPTRSFVAVPAAAWLLAHFGLQYAPGAIRWIGLCCIPIVFFQSVSVATVLDASRTLGRTHDQLLALAVFERIANVVPDFSMSKKYKIDFYGARGYISPYPRPESTASGYSFFEWDGGNPSRMIYFMNLIGYTNLTEVSSPERMEVLSKFLDMPVWPAQGSIKLVGDTILARMGPAPGVKHLFLTPNVDASSSVVFSLDSADRSSWRTENAKLSERTSDGFVFDAGRDPMMIFTIGDNRLQDCSILWLTASVRAETNDQAQMFFLRSGEKGFSEPSSHMVSFEGNGKDFQQVRLFAVNPSGFGSELRFDPVVKRQGFTIKDLEVRCTKRGP